MYQVTDYLEKKEDVEPLMDLLTADGIEWIIKEKEFKNGKSKYIKYAGFRTDGFTPTKEEKKTLSYSQV